MTIRDYIKRQCIDTDIQNMVDNGFRTEEEICDYYDKDIHRIYKDKAEMTLVQIYDEYYGIETLLDMEVNI